MSGKLYVVGTPIGNLGDLSPRAAQVLADFHPLRCKSRKTYEYRILNHRFRDPLERLYSTFVHAPLDVE